MKKMKTRLAAILIAILMITALLPAYAYADFPSLPGDAPSNNQPPVNIDDDEDPTEPGEEQDPEEPQDHRIETSISIRKGSNQVFDINDFVSIVFSVEYYDELLQRSGEVFHPAVSVTIDGRTVSDAFPFTHSAFFPASDLGVGTHELLLSFPGNEQYKPCQAAETVTIVEKTLYRIEDWYPEGARPGCNYAVGGTLVDENGVPQAGKRLMIFVPVGFEYANGNTFYVETDENGNFRKEIDYSIPTAEGTLKLTVSVSADASHAALREEKYIHFSGDIHTVTVLSDASGGSVHHGASTYASGDLVSLYAQPEPGYRFTGWEVLEGGVSVEDDCFIMPSANVRVRAHFEAVPVTRITITGNIPENSYLMLYTGVPFTFTGELTDENGSLALAAPGALSVYHDQTEVVDDLEVIDGRFSYTITPTIVESFRVTFYYQGEQIGYSDSRYVSVYESSVNYVYLVNTDAKTEYRSGEQLDLTNVYLIVNWNNGRDDRIPVTADMVKTDLNVAGNGWINVRIEYVDSDNFVWILYHEVEVRNEPQYFTVSYVTGDVCPAPEPRLTTWNSYFGCILGESMVLIPEHGDDYDFFGWFLDEDLTEPASYTTRPSSDVTLYASFDGPYELIEEVNLNIRAPKIGEPLCYYFENDPYSDSLETCGVFFAGKPDPRFRIIGAYWYPDPFDYDAYGEEIWEVFTEGVPYCLSLELEANAGFVFKGHRSAYDEEYNLDTTKTFRLTVNGQITEALGNVGAGYSWLPLRIPPVPALFGDLDGDNDVTVLDVTTLLNVLAGSTTAAAECDLNGDFSVNVNDVTMLLNLLSGN